MRYSISLVVTVLLLSAGCTKDKQAEEAPAPKATAAPSAPKRKAPPPFKGTFKEAVAVLRTCKQPCARESIQTVVNFKGEVPEGPAQFAIKGCASLCQQLAKESSAE